MQTTPTPYAIIDTTTGATIARYAFDDSPDWWAWYNTYLQSPQWRRVSDQCKARDGYTCQKCGVMRGELRSDGSRVVLHAHHLTYERVGNERQKDLLCECDRCHGKEHRKWAGMTAIQSTRKR